MFFLDRDIVIIHGKSKEGKNTIFHQQKEEIR